MPMIIIFKLSMRGINELAIHIHKFTNVDLFQQGLYQLRIRVVYDDETYVYSASPYHIYNNNTNTELSSSLITRPYHTDTQYYSKLFLIKYCDEENEIDEFCFFRIEFPDGWPMDTTPLYIEADLLFSDIVSLGGWESLKLKIPEV